MMPDFTFKQYLKGFTDSKIYFYPNPGNGGDALIACAAVKLFKELGLDLVIVQKGMDLTGKTVVMGGGGSFTENYVFYADFIQQWHNRVKSLIIAPQTISGHYQLISELDNNTVLFCREKTSYHYVCQTVNQNVQVYLDHDLAFHLKPAELMPKLPLKPIVLYLRTMIRKKIRDARALYVFREDIEKTSVRTPLDNVDISTKINYCCGQDRIRLVNRTTGEIFRFVDFFNTVHTNRLHIAIAGYLLGKKVFMYPNSYYKNRSIYEFSLSRDGNVTFVSG